MISSWILSFKTVTLYTVPIFNKGYLNYSLFTPYEIFLLSAYFH